MNPSVDPFLSEANQKRVGLLREVAEFLLATKKWWLAPFIVLLVLLGALVFLGGTAAGPFVYTLF